MSTYSQSSASRKSYVSRRLAQQRMTLSNLEWPFHASRAISAVARSLYKSFLVKCIYAFVYVKLYRGRWQQLKNVYPAALLSFVVAVAH